MWYGLKLPSSLSCVPILEFIWSHMNPSYSLPRVVILEFFWELFEIHRIMWFSEEMEPQRHFNYKVCKVYTRNAC